MQEVGGSIPPSSTKLSGPSSRPATRTDPAVVRILIISGIALTAIGLVGGFTAMIVFENSPWTRLIGLVPIGFVSLLTGLVVDLLSVRPDTRDRQDRQDG